MDRSRKGTVSVPSNILWNYSTILNEDNKCLACDEGIELFDQPEKWFVSEKIDSDTVKLEIKMQWRMVEL